ncbi:MAG: pirin family protein [Pseudomonadota bacterium]|nr:pirin family protein [Pseudomonadota bacterium]
MNSTLTTPREIERIVAGQATQDGDGVRLTRLLTADLQQRLDPFLMLDNFGTDNPGDYIGGFPEHPHRGFETVTLMLQGRMRHRDNSGNVGLLGPGSVQWMTAGRGVIHSEMPEQQDGAMEGFQLWLNLPARDKLREPWYRDIAAAEMPLRTGPGFSARVIAGRSGEVNGAVQREGSEPLLLDLELAPGAVFEQVLPASHNAFVVAYRGALDVAGQPSPIGALAILQNRPDSDGVRLQAGPDGARAIVVAGRPLGEPIAQYGPFVMNTRQQLQEAVEDFKAGRLA